MHFVAPASENVPSAHSVGGSTVDGHMEPAGQMVHEVDPGLTAKKPAGHLVGSASVWRHANPALHVEQAVAFADE